MARDGMIFYKSFQEALKNLPEDIRLECYDAIFSYGLDGEEPELTGVSAAIFALVKPQIDANNKRRDNGSKGGRPKEHTDEENTEARKARQKAEYFEWREQVMERDGRKCTKCGSTENLNAHHIKDFYDYPELRYDVNNGVTLCAKCHQKIHKEANRITGNEPKKTKSANEITGSEAKEKEKVKEKEKEKVKDINNTLSGKPDRAGMRLEIIGYLNQKTGKDFRHSSQGTVRLIEARLNDGYSIEDFKRVIDNKVAEWKGTDQEQYLRPETLFAPSHFESYLNQRMVRAKPKAGGLSADMTHMYDMDELRRRAKA